MRGRPLVRSTKTKRLWAVRSLLLLSLAMACGEEPAPSGPNSPNPQVPTAVAASAGDGQTAAAGTAVGTAPAVLVSGTTGPLAGVSVTFQVAIGGGSVAGATAVSNQNGIAFSGGWTLGTSAGTNTLTAAVAGLPSVTFTAQGVAGPPAALSASAGDNQTATAGMPVPIEPAVLVVDQFGNPVQGIDVGFSVSSGGGSIAAGNAVSDQAGVATAGTWTLGVAAGPNQLTAAIQGSALQAVTFSATATPDVAAAMSLNGGDNQSAPAGTPVPVAPSVLVTDQHGNPVGGATVVFAVAGGGGSVSGGTAATDGAGIAAVGAWTLGCAVGGNTLTATTGSVPSVTFAASAVVGAAAAMTKQAGDNQSAAAGTAVATAPSVLATDQCGNPVPGETVTFTVTSGGGSVSGSPATTGANGIAAAGAWTLGPAAGTNTLDAALGALPTVTFTATGTVTPANVQVNAGNNQSAAVGSAVPVSPSVLVTDALMQPVQGVAVNFAVTNGGGAVTGGSTQTNANGIAMVGGWTLGTTVGSNTLEATVQGSGINGNPVAFTATATPGSPASIAVNDGNNQSAPAGSAVPTAPSVVVRDQFNNRVPGVTVDFSVSGGGGSVSGASQQTNANGIARVGSWTIQAGTNTLEALAQGMGISGNPVVFTATGTTPAAFDIVVRFSAGSTPTAAQQQAFANAESRWQQLITGDIPDVPFAAGPGSCAGAPYPALNETVDDVIIYAALVPIDGPGGILGSAGPCWIRGNALPILGGMQFDIDDLGAMSMATLEAVILHEMAHVLGLGTIWNTLGLLQNPSCPSVSGGQCVPNNVGADTHFDGPQAISSFDNVGGTAWTLGSKVPVENTLGGPGTRDGHWRESTFVTELMTGFINAGSNPLSEVTTASMADMGYVVNLGASDPYSLANPNALRALIAGPVIDMGDDIWRGPLRVVGRGGRFIRVLLPR